MHTRITQSARRALRAASLLLVSALGANLAHAQFNVLWWDSTPDYSGQALNSYRKEMSDYLTAFNGGTVFNSTYVASETAGTLATHLASNPNYDVIVFDATSGSAKFNTADITAVRSFYNSGNNNLLFDGTLYIRSIDYNAGTNFPGFNGASGKLTVNEVYQLAQRGGGIMVGTDHSGFQVDANQIVSGLLPSAAFSGTTYPSTDGVFYGTQLLGGIAPLAAVDIFNHWDSVPTEGIAPTGTFFDFSGVSRTLYSQVDVSDDPGGGLRYSYISTSWAPGTGTTIVTDPTPGGTVPDGGLTALLIGFAVTGLAFFRRRT